MHKFFAIVRKLIILAAAAFLLLSCTAGNRYMRIDGYAQGGKYSIKLNLKDVTVPPEEIKDSIESILTHIDTTLSGYNKGSMLSRFNAGQAVVPNKLFRDVYEYGYRLWEQSEGALDFAAGPLYDAWGFGFKSGDFPSDKDIVRIKESCGTGKLPATLPSGIVNPETLGNPRLNYNAVAQGLSCDIVAEYLYRIGVRDMLVDIGEIWCDGLNPSGQPWSVGIDRPDGTDTYEGVWSSEGRPQGIVTSGNYRKFYVKDGRKFAHTIDPVSGYPVEHNLLSATVVSSSSAAEADAMATWCMVVGLEKAKEIILKNSRLEACLTYEEDGMRQWFSPGFILRKQ